MIHVIHSIECILQYRSHCMTSQIIGNLHSAALQCSIQLRAVLSACLSGPVCLEELLCLHYAVPTTTSSRRPGSHSFIHSFQFQWHCKELLTFSSFFFSFWNSSENLVLCYIYVVFVYCSVVCCSDLKYQEIIQCRKDRSGPKNLRMMRAACDLLHISKLTAHVVAEHWVTYMTGRLYHALG